MSDFELVLTPTLRHAGTEGSMDTSINSDGFSTQRTGFIEVYTDGDKKMLELNDGEVFDDTIPTWSDEDFIVTE